MPPAEPNSPPVDYGDGEENCSGYQEAPKLFIEAGVEMLAPACEGRDSDKQSE
jgi:hypothetical protein